MTNLFATHLKQESPKINFVITIDGLFRTKCWRLIENLWINALRLITSDFPIDFLYCRKFQYIKHRNTWLVLTAIHISTLMAYSILNHLIETIIYSIRTVEYWGTYMAQYHGVAIGFRYLKCLKSFRCNQQNISFGNRESQLSLNRLIRVGYV